jgi:hypothetical protein
VGVYNPRFITGTRVIFQEKDHPKSGQHCTVLGALHNPSQRAEHQWYDVRFDDYSVGRFLEGRLQPVSRNE